MFEKNLSIFQTMEQWIYRPWVKRGYKILQIVALILPIYYVATLISDVMKIAPPEPIPIGDNANRFGISLKNRKAIFTYLAKQSKGWRKKANRSFPKHKWSQEDDYHWTERRDVHRIAKKYKLHYSLVFMILDEGIRKHWTGPDGKMLPNYTVPLQPRLK